MQITKVRKLNQFMKLIEIILNTVIAVYNNHPRDPKFVAVVTGGRCLEVDSCYNKTGFRPVS
jgi:hypothetical protein